MGVVIKAEDDWRHVTGGLKLQCIAITTFSSTYLKYTYVECETKILILADSNNLEICTTRYRVCPIYALLRFSSFQPEHSRGPIYKKKSYNLS